MGGIVDKCMTGGNAGCCISVATTYRVHATRGAVALLFDLLNAVAVCLVALVVCCGGVNVRL